MRLYAQLDCKFPDRAEVIDAGDICELVYYRCVLRCRENLTDGVIDRRLLGRWFAGIRGKPAQHLDALVTVGLLDLHELGWCIPPDVWRKWNPTREEVERKRDAETERKRQWKERQRDNVATTSRTPEVNRRDAQPKTEPEPEGKPEPEPEPLALTLVKQNITSRVRRPESEGAFEILTARILPKAAGDD